MKVELQRRKGVDNDLLAAILKHGKWSPKEPSYLLNLPFGVEGCNTLELTRRMCQSLKDRGFLYVRPENDEDVYRPIIERIERYLEENPFLTRGPYLKKAIGHYRRTHLRLVNGCFVSKSEPEWDVKPHTAFGRIARQIKKLIPDRQDVLSWHDIRGIALMVDRHRLSDEQIFTHIVAASDRNLRRAAEEEKPETVEIDDLWPPRGMVSVDNQTLDHLNHTLETLRRDGFDQVSIGIEDGKLFVHVREPIE